LGNQQTQEEQNMEQTAEPTVSLSLTVKNSTRALNFYSEAFGAEELLRMPSPEGGVAHAEFMVGNTRIYISDEAEEWHAFAMPEGAMASCLFSIMTKDCDTAYNRAVKAGAKSLSEPMDQFWGARSAIIKDPFGYRWSLIQKTEDVSPEELERRAQTHFSS
jgi:PhnB protein